MGKSMSFFTTMGQVQILTLLGNLGASSITPQYLSTQHSMIRIPSARTLDTALVALRDAP
jgi:hypothetical protein